jgi:hypothetical protein
LADGEETDQGYQPSGKDGLSVHEAPTGEASQRLVLSGCLNSWINL